MDWQSMLFQNWSGIFRTILVGILAYVTLVLFLRISGKRTLAKLNAFDLVVTVALGSTLSAILLQESIALAEGAVALGLLILMQFLVTFVSVRSPRFAKAVRSEPTLLAHDGSFCHEAMKRERVTREEALSAVRSAGARDIESVQYLVLESDGTISAAIRQGKQ
jgi:Predicted membrane protein